MKLNLTFKVTMTDEFEDSEVEKINPVETIVEDIKRGLKEGLSAKGTVDISDYSLTVS